MCGGIHTKITIYMCGQIHTKLPLCGRIHTKITLYICGRIHIKITIYMCGNNNLKKQHKFSIVLFPAERAQHAWEKRKRERIVACGRFCAKPISYMCGRFRRKITIEMGRIHTKITI